MYCDELDILVVLVGFTHDGKNRIHYLDGPDDLPNNFNFSAMVYAYNWIVVGNL